MPQMCDYYITQKKVVWLLTFQLLSPLLSPWWKMHTWSQIQAQVEASFFSVKLTGNTISGRNNWCKASMASIRKLNRRPYWLLLHHSHHLHSFPIVHMHSCMAVFIYIWQKKRKIIGNTRIIIQADLLVKCHDLTAEHIRFADKAKQFWETMYKALPKP